MTELSEPLYKWLLADRRTPTKHSPWPVDDLIWTPPANPIICQSGWHGMEEKDVLAHLPGVGALLYEVEVRGAQVTGGDKFAAESMRIVNFIGEATEQKLRLLMCDVAEDVLPIYEEWAPNDDRCRKSIEAGRAYALDPTNETKAAWAARAAEAAGAAGAAGVAEVAWAAGVAARVARVAEAARAAGAAEAAEVAWAAGVAARADPRREAMDQYSNWLVVRIESNK